MRHLELQISTSLERLSLAENQTVLFGDTGIQWVQRQYSEIISIAYLYAVIAGHGEFTQSEQYLVYRSEIVSEGFLQKILRTSNKRSRLQQKNRQKYFPRRMWFREKKIRGFSKIREEDWNLSYLENKVIKTMLCYYIVNFLTQLQMQIHRRIHNKHTHTCNYLYPHTQTQQKLICHIVLYKNTLVFSGIKR